MQIMSSGTAGFSELLGGAAPVAAPTEPAAEGRDGTTTAEQTSGALAFAALLNAALQPAPTTPLLPDAPAAGGDAATGSETGGESDGQSASGAPSGSGKHAGRGERRGAAAADLAHARGARQDMMDALHYGLALGRDAEASADAAHDAAHDAADAHPGAPNANQGESRLLGRARAAARHERAHGPNAAAATDATETTAAADASAAADAAVTTAATDALAATALADAQAAASTNAAGAAAATAASNAATAASTSVVRDADALVPELQQRLARVVERMKEEFGHDVQIVETARSQARQDALFAQGRTAPGEVVTWTRDSQHTRGRAADVQIDGGWDDAAAFAQLQQVAREEGLRTLGPRDPGHLELARHGADVAIAQDAQDARESHDARAAAKAEQRAERKADATSAQTDARTRALAAATPGEPSGARGRGSDMLAMRHAEQQAAREARSASRASDARVADVAAVADVAEVATVATVAVPGVAARGEGRGQGAGHGRGHAYGRDGAPGALRAAQRRATAPGADARAGDGAGASATASSAALATGSAVAGDAAVAPTLGAHAVDRVTRAQDIAEAGSGRNVSHLTLRIDNAAGGEDRIRIDLRGTAVGASIDVADLASADRMSGRVGELRQALERHGLTTDTVQISSTGSARAESGADAGRLAAAVSAAGRGADAGATGHQSSSQQNQQQQSHAQQRETLDRDARQQQQQQQRRDRDDEAQYPGHSGDARGRGRRNGRDAR